MTKRLLFLFTLLFIAGAAHTQGLRKNGPRLLPEIPASQRTPLMRFESLPHFVPRRAAIEVDKERQMWWGYFTGNDVAGAIGFGASAAEVYWGAIGIAPSEALPKGKTIKAVRFGIAGASVMKDFHVWIANKLPNSLDDVELDIPVDMGSINNQTFTEVELPTAYAMTNQTVYVGYTFEITESNAESNYPMLLRYNGANIYNSLWVRTSKTMSTWSNDSQEYGPLAIQVLLDGDFPHNAVQVASSFHDAFALPNGFAEAAVTLTSKGLGKVQSIDYIVGDANADQDEQHLDFEPFEGMDAETTVHIPMKADEVPGRTIRYLTVTKVNGVENAVEDASSQGYVATLSKEVPRRTVIEEFTGTWCGWCPTGITGMQMVNEQYPDKAITIIVHGDDPMTIDYGVTAPSYPYALLDRSTPVHPYFGLSGQPAGILTLVGERNKMLTEASVELQQPVLSKAGNVTFKTQVTFNYNNNESHYCMGYALLADGLTGTGRNWMQANFFCQEENKANYADDPNLLRWTEGNAYMPMTYDHVAIASKGMNADGTVLKAPIVDGDTRTFSTSFPLSGNPVLQSFDQLSVVAVLFNKATGEIVNADIHPVTIAEDFIANKAQLNDFAPATVLKNSTAKVSVPVANFGREGIKSLDYTIKTNGQTSDTLHLDLPRPITNYGIYMPVDFPIPTPTETGFANYIIAITAVNGQTNEATTGKSSSGSITVVAKASPRKTVVEEFTGTWCMWCPRGLAGMKRARSEYPDDAVLISIHGGRDNEPMLVSAFSSLLNSVSGFPSANVNRYRTVDPYLGEGSEGWGLGAVIEDEQSKLAEASIELHQPTLNEATGVINFTTDVTFQLNRKSAPYLLSYVLVADGLHGEGEDWKQLNAYPAYYPGAYQDDPYMNEICNIWEISADVTFNDVAVAANGINTGVTGSLKTTVEEGQTQSHSSKFTIKSNKLAKMATELRVIALLYDKTLKRFINADEKKVITAEPDAVDDITEAAEQEAARYSIDGKRIPRPMRGINLVRTRGGNVHKVIVK